VPRVSRQARNPKQAPTRGRRRSRQRCRTSAPAVIAPARPRRSAEGNESQVVERYTESIHGKGPLKSGLTVTATCTNCTPRTGSCPTRTLSPASTPRQRALDLRDLPRRHRRAVRQDIHSTSVTRTGKKLPAATTATAPTRSSGPTSFKLTIMSSAGGATRDRQDLLPTNLSREGVPARLYQDGEVLRLPMVARHPSDVRPGVAPPSATTSCRPARSGPPGGDAAFRPVT